MLGAPSQAPFPVGDVRDLRQALDADESWCIIGARVHRLASPVQSFDLNAVDNLRQSDGLLAPAECEAQNHLTIRIAAHPQPILSGTPQDVSRFIERAARRKQQRKR